MHPAILLSLALALLAPAQQDPADGPEAGPAAAPRIEHVVLVSMDTTRRERLGFHGGTARTPHLDGLAEAGTMFESAYAPTPVTLPSHATLLTGTYPSRHGLRDNALFALGPDAVTLAELLGAAGLRTAAVVAAFVLDSQFGLDQGFDSYDDRFQTGLGGVLGLERRSATEVTDAALRWLDEREEGPFFLFVHYFDPHHPYAPPEPYASEAADPYDGELAYMDAQLGRLVAGLRARELLERCLLVVTADHGESLGDHGEATHGIFLYDSTQAVPLVLSGPGIPAGRRVAELVSLVDVAPTLLDLLGLSIPAGMQGRSFVPALQGNTLEPRPVLLESWTGWYSFGWAPLTALVRGDYKYIAAPRPELYDLRRDPGELHDLIGERPDLARELAQELAALRAALGGEAGWGQEAALTDEERARLEALGYVSGAPQEGTSRRDPKDGLAEFALLQRAGAAQEEGRHRDALELYDEVLARNPNNFVALERSGMALLQLSRHAEAIERLERSNLFPGLPMFSLAQAHAGEGREERALELMAEIRRRNPRFAPAHLFFARYHLARGETSQAIEAYELLLENWFGDPAFRARIEGELEGLRAR